MGSQGLREGGRNNRRATGILCVKPARTSVNFLYEGSGEGGIRVRRVGCLGGGGEGGEGPSIYNFLLTFSIKKIEYIQSYGIFNFGERHNELTI